MALAQAERSERLSDQRGVSTKWGLLCAGLLRASDKARARAEDVERAWTDDFAETARERRRARRRDGGSASRGTPRSRGSCARWTRCVWTTTTRCGSSRTSAGSVVSSGCWRGAGPNGIVGDDSAFLDAPSVLATRRAMDALFDATTAAVALAKDAAEDARMGSDESVARDKLGETLRACHDALLVMADEDESAARVARSSANAPPSGGGTYAAVVGAARRAERRDRDGRRDAARAAKGAGGEGGAHRGSAGRARGAPRRGGREQARGRLRRENERVPRRNRRRARDAIRQTQQGEEDSGGESSRHADEGYRGDERGYREHDEPIGKEDGRVETASDRFGSAASGYARARRARRRRGARARFPRGTETLLQTETPLQTARDRATRRRTRKQSPKNALRTPRFVRKTSRFGSPSPPARTRSRTPTRFPRREPRGARGRRLCTRRRPRRTRSRETVVARGGGVSFDEDPADRSYASLVKARARRADAPAARSVNDGALAETRAARGAAREADDERGRGARRRGSAGEENAKKWTPPPWDERPLRKSDKKSRGVTNPYASKPTKARVTRR